MAAPLPPPANAPISAPAPAPPPMNAAERLPLPLTERATMPVSTEVSLPLMVTELSRTSSSAPPLKWPMLLASTTVPRADCAFFNHSLSVHDHGLGDGCGKSLSRAAVLGTECFAKTHGDHRTDWDGDGLWGRLAYGGLACRRFASRGSSIRSPLSPDALGFSVEDAGVAGLLAQPITKHSASSATTYNMRVDFNVPP